MSAAKFKVVNGRNLNLRFPGLIAAWQMNLDLVGAEQLAARQGTALSFTYEFKVNCIAHRVNGYLGGIQLTEVELEVIRLTVSQNIKVQGVRIESLEVTDVQLLWPTTGDGIQIWTFAATMVHP